VNHHVTTVAKQGIWLVNAQMNVQTVDQVVAWVEVVAVLLVTTVTRLDISPETAWKAEMVVLETIRPFAVTAMALDIWLVIARRVTNKAVTTVVNRDI
jgi:hypothetical protein